MGTPALASHSVLVSSLGYSGLEGFEMFKHILVAIDGSTYSQEVLPVAIEVARKFDSEIFVLHVSEHDKGRAVIYSLETPAGAAGMVGDAVKKLRDLGLAAKGQVRDMAAGHVAKAIVETAEANGIDLIVMGSRGLSDVQGLLLGSVTHKVMQAAGISVLVVRPSIKSAPVTNDLVPSSRD
jgi:nucleotide-binding universal stress UspA family protein